jgi:signal transduction histidine kinase
MKSRTFLLTLFLFLSAVFGGILLIALLTYRDTLSQARERAVTGDYFISTGLMRDLTALNARDADMRQGLDALLPIYGAQARNQRAGISLYNGGLLIYSNITGEDVSTDVAGSGERLITLSTKVDAASFEVNGLLAEPFSMYLLRYRLDITDAVTGWRNMKNTMLTVGLAFSALLSVCLYLLFGSIFNPLVEISRISRRIAEGEYATRLAVKGKDELAGMAESFNHMAEEIERQMDELTKTADSKQMFIDNFAHELKTPLTAIHGFADYMQKGALSEDDRDFALDCILTESKRIQVMAYQMMELANLRNDQIRMEPLSVSELFDRVERTMRVKAAEKNIEFVFQCETEWLKGDAVLLESLLTNLADNAVKASEPGSRVTFAARIEGQKPILSVADRGKGISEKDLAKLTQPYYRVETHRHSKDGGAGLGLAICELIAEKHGGKMQIESTEGIGTTVSVIFPANFTTS